MAKPLFQLKSMAQTRACSKVLRQVFAWIVVLAGYRPTPAEEMTGNEQFEDHEQQTKKEPVKQPQRASETKKAEAQTQQATQQPAQTQQAAGLEGQKVSGIIETVKPGKDNTLWLSLKNNILAFVEVKDIDADMKPDYFIKFRGVPAKTGTVEFFRLKALMELSAIQDAEVSQPAPDPKAPLADDAQSVADALFGEKKPEPGQAAVAEMVKNGDLKKASDLPPADKKPGTVGMKRAQRLYTIATQSKKNNNGFNEAVIKKILAQWEPPLEHLRDLPTEDYPTFEAWAAGESDWRITFGGENPA